MKRCSPVLEARRIGCDANVRLRHAGSGEVVAVFQRALYFEFPTGLICIGDYTIGDGPLNVLCDATAIDDWRALTTPGAPAIINDGILCFSSTTISFPNSVVWTPPDPPPFDIARLREGIASLLALLPGSLPDDALAGLIRLGTADSGRIQRAAHGPIRSLLRWTFGPPGENPSKLDTAVAGLLGLGPGLTPSGDDFLAGFAVALRVIGENRRLRSLSKSIAVQAATRTNKISAAHLSSAVCGRLRHDMHLLLNGILDDNRKVIARCLDQFTATDHTSPWDATAGIAMALGGRLCREYGSVDHLMGIQAWSV